MLLAFNEMLDDMEGMMQLIHELREDLDAERAAHDAPAEPAAAIPVAPEPQPADPVPQPDLVIEPAAPLLLLLPAIPIHHSVVNRLSPFNTQVCIFILC